MRAVEMVFENMLSSAEVRGLTQLRTRSGRSLEECLAEVIRGRTSVVRRHLIVGAITSERLQAQLGGRQQLDRDRLFQRAIKTAFPGLVNVAGRLTPSKFFIVGDDTVSKLITAAHDFEKALNDSIANQLAFDA